MGIIQLHLYVGYDCTLSAESCVGQYSRACNWKWQLLAHKHRDQAAKQKILLLMTMLSQMCNTTNQAVLYFQTACLLPVLRGAAICCATGGVFAHHHSARLKSSVPPLTAVSLFVAPQAVSSRTTICPLHTLSVPYIHPDTCSFPTYVIPKFSQFIVN